MQRSRPESRIVAILSLFLAAASAAAVADQGLPALPRASLAILAPDRLRQGDPLLAWIVEIDYPTDIRELEPAPRDEASPSAAPSAAGGSSRPRARLLGPGGELVAEARCFELPSILEPGRTGQIVARIFGALIPLPTGLAPGAYAIAASSEGGGAAVASVQAEARASIQIDARDFTLETISLDEANTALRARPTKRQRAEARKLYALLGTTDDAAVFADLSPFIFPVEGGFKSAGFGDRRRYLLSTGGSEQSEHAGIDWGVVKGTPVRACERGRVVLVADRELTGKSLVVEHLPGLYSLYFHLSSIEVRAGDFVERGQRIALSGSTGMSTGPHLHWELRARGQAVDPEYWLGPPLLDKEAIKATISALIEGR